MCEAQQTGPGLQPRALASLQGRRGGEQGGQGQGRESEAVSVSEQGTRGRKSPVCWLTGAANAFAVAFDTRMGRFLACVLSVSCLFLAAVGLSCGMQGLCWGTWAFPPVEAPGPVVAASGLRRPTARGPFVPGPEVEPASPAWVGRP